MAKHTTSPGGPLQEPGGGEVLGLRVGPFVLQEEVGVGGFGAVYRATHEESPGVFAIKLIHWHQAKDPALLRRFQREAQTLAQLQHPNVVRLIDFGHIERLGFYMVMEFLNGIGLQEVIQRAYPLPMRRLKSIVQQLCHVLAFAHSNGVLHRDLKPSNIIICTGPEGDVVKLIDFGIAAVAEQTQLTQSGTFLGSPAYMSPEQIKGESKLMAPQSDLYSLGILVTQLLTQRRPFEASNLTGFVTHHLFTPAPSLATLRPEQPWHPALEACIARALAKETHARYPHAMAFWQALSAGLDAQGEFSLQALPHTQPLVMGGQASPEGSEQHTRQLHQLLATRSGTAAVTSLLDETANLTATPFVTHHQQALPTPSLPHPVQVPPQLIAQGPSLTDEPPVQTPAHRKGQAWFVVLAALLGGALVACVWLLATRSSPPQARSIVPSASSQILIESTPTRAHIWRGNRVLGQTPQALFGKPGEQGEITLRKPGFAPVKVAWTYRTQRFVRRIVMRPSSAATPAPMPMPMRLLPTRARPPRTQPTYTRRKRAARPRTRRPQKRRFVPRKTAPQRRPRPRPTAPTKPTPRRTKAIDPFDGLLSPTPRR